ncbi:unnamed protein product [Linum tenue]|uniref:Replication factor A C-terminal domain-containing protein n=1 Tax=Linum tenue TaxID=586396 RepID=A0AAV0Q5D8_9ROSI|nr:unnamed protein product [Linum tenue]
MSDGAAMDEHFVEGDRESSVVDNHGSGVAFAGANRWQFVFSIGPMVTNDDDANLENDDKQGGVEEVGDWTEEVDGGGKMEVALVEGRWRSWRRRVKEDDWRRNGDELVLRGVLCREWCSFRSVGAGNVGGALRLSELQPTHPKFSVYKKRGMAPQLLKDLATHSRKWIIQCRVSRKWIATNCNSGKVLHLDMVLIDSEGSDIWAMVPPLLIPKFESSLIEQEVYEIRHFKVAMTKNTFRPVPNRLMIEFDAATLVQHIKTVSPILAYKFYFLNHAAMMKRLYDKKNLSGRVFFLLFFIANPGEMVKVTLWGSIGKQLEDIISRNERTAVILTITSVFVDEFKGATQLKANLDIPEVLEFKARDTNLPAPVLLPEVPAPEIPKISLAQLNDFKSNEAQTDKLFSVEGKVTQVRPNWCYMGCVACPRKVEEDLEEYFCGHCKTTSSIAKAKYRVKFQREDSFGEADFAILEHEGLRFFGVMADELFQSNQRNKEPLPPQIHQIVNMTLKLTVKLTEFNIMNPQTEISVVSIDHDPLQQLNKDLCAKDLGGVTSVGEKMEAALDCEADDQK